MLAHRVVDSFRERAGAPAIIDEGGEATSYAALHASIEAWRQRLKSFAIEPGEVVAVEGAYSTELLACFWALASAGQIIMPLTEQSPGRDDETGRLAEIRHRLSFDAAGSVRHDRRAIAHRHEMLCELRERGGSGLVLFSSGTEGRPKIVLHDLERLLAKYQRPLKAMRTLLFLVFDHIAGLDALFYTLCAGGCCVVENSRRPDDVGRAIARHRVEILPATPSFLGLLLAAEVHEQHDLTSLKVVAYGSEPMPQATLARLAQVLPGASLIQRYGTTELGSPSSRSRDRDTLWMKIGGEGVRTKIVDGVLWVKAETAMLGYLNAPSPFDGEGWLNTGDMVEVHDDWLRVLGRRSEMINVGGEKVYPSEVESVLLEMPNVAAASVWGEPNALLGQIVVARLTIVTPRSLADLRRDVREFCRGRLARYQTPVKVVLDEAAPHTYRHKKTRGAGTVPPSE